MSDQAPTDTELAVQTPHSAARWRRARARLGAAFPGAYRAVAQLAVWSDDRVDWTADQVAYVLGIPRPQGWHIEDQKEKR